MENQVIPYKDKIDEALAKAEMGEINAGDVFISTSYSRPSIVKIIEIYFDKKSYDEYGKKGWNTDLEIHTKIKYHQLEDWEGNKWSKIKTSSLQDLHSNRNIQYKLNPNMSVQDYLKSAKDLLDGKVGVEIYSDKESDGLNTETGLISRDSKQTLQVIQSNLQQKKHQAELIQQFVGFEMSRRAAELEKVRQNLKGVLAVFEKKIKKVMRIITTIELYLGIDEELFQIQDGERASKETPITFRQQVLYMDEEIGHWKDGGLDFTNIDWFDKWLVENENYKKLVPEDKCLVVFRPRRKDKKYNDVHLDAVLNAINRSTYLLIRNGDCLFRVYTENIRITPRLFPKRDELMNLMAQVEKELENGSFYGKEEAQEKVDDMLYQYKKRAVLMQGLIDRTDVFHPLPVEKVNIFDMDSLGDKVNFIYDDEATLPSGRMSFWDWHKHLNSQIGKGSRIIVTSRYDKYDCQNRIYFYCNEYNTPPSPNVGVYEVEEYEQEFKRKIFDNDTEKFKKFIQDYPRYRVIRSYNARGGAITEYGYYEAKNKAADLTIMHNPKDIVNGSWGEWKNEERKNRIRFKIKLSDENIINYDQIDLKDIEFYLNSRVDRPNYLEMIPILENIKKWRLEELENEKGFVRMLVDRASLKYKKDTSILEEKIWELVDWWKYKNTWKRPIEKDDTKAVRMIEKELNRIINN